MRTSPVLPFVKPHMPLRQASSKARTGILFEGYGESNPMSHPKKDRSLFGKVLDRALLAGGGLLVLLGVAKPMFVSYNPPGTYSLVQDNFKGGTQPDVYGEGSVFVIPGVRINHQYDTTAMGVKQIIQPRTQDGTLMSRVVIEMNFNLNPDMLHKIQTEILSNQSHIVNDGNTIFEKNNEIAQKAYMILIRDKVREAVMDMFVASIGERAHLDVAQIQEWLDKGVDMTYTTSEGEKRELKVTPIKDQLAPLGIEVNRITLTEIELPDTMIQRFEDRANASIEETNARLMKVKNEAQAAAQAEFSKIGAIEAAERSKGQADVTTLEREMNVEIEKLKAETQKVQSEAQANYDAAKAEADREAQLIIEKARADAQQIKAEGQSGYDRITAEGQAQAIVLISKAEADRYEALGKPLQEHPLLVAEIELLAKKQELLGLAANQDMKIMVVDPDTGLELDVITVAGNGNPLDLQNHLTGEAVSDQALDRNQP